MTITYQEYPETKTVEMAVNGRITRADYDTAVDQMQTFIDAQGTVKFIEIVHSFDGFDPSVIWPGVKFDFRNISHISHVAIVSDIGWLGPISKAAGALMPTKLRTFTLAELDKAREWAKAA